MIKPVDKGDIDRVVTEQEMALLIEFTPPHKTNDFAFGAGGVKLLSDTTLLETIREEFALNEMRRFQF
jgi:hypothetical protein